MIISKQWLAEYVDLSMPLHELTDRLTITGLNLEGVETVGKDTAVDLEVTSNRPDCLGHIGVAREVAVIFDKQLKKSEPRPSAGGEKAASLTSVEIKANDLCPRYTARLIKGVKIGPSPEWLADRLRTLGIAVINNVVDVTNYVMMEIGQPLHAFDFAKLRGGKIVVRRSTSGEEFVAIDHKTYTLTGEEVVIADAERPVALGGVMGGHDTEVSADTVDVLIEAADFDPLAVRGAARRHVLHSPSSYRFERGVDPDGIDWASRRCCELILETAGGTLCEGVLDKGAAAQPRGEVKMRFNQIPRLLGVDVSRDAARRILTALGCEETHHCDHCVKVIPPAWRADLTREVDLLEEVARIHGYDKIPEDVGVRMTSSHRTREDLVLERVRSLITAAGFDEALTLSAVNQSLAALFQPWTNAPPLATSTAVLQRADCLRQSVVPSLLTCRRTNEARSNPVIELFEIAKVYLPQSGKLPQERRVLAFTTGGDYRVAKGVVETLLERVAPDLEWGVAETSHDLLDTAHSCALTVAGEQLGVIGKLSQAGQDAFDLRSDSTIAEIDLGPIIAAARLVPVAGELSNYQPVSRDLNVVFDASVRWDDIASIVQSEGGAELEAVTFQDDTYRDPKQLGQGKKSVLFSIQLRKPHGTLTSEEADAVRDKILAALGKNLGGTLRA